MLLHSHNSSRYRQGKLFTEKLRVFFFFFLKQKQDHKNNYIFTYSIMQHGFVGTLHITGRGRKLNRYVNNKSTSKIMLYCYYLLQDLPQFLNYRSLACTFVLLHSLLPFGV